jgi:4-hydroxy-L-threonine phosphate dehydrogenase PdxA
MRYFGMHAQHEERPLLAITMGDPAGIGPEIIVKALADRELYDISRPVVLGDCGVISSALQREASKQEALDILNSWWCRAWKQRP